MRRKILSALIFCALLGIVIFWLTDNDSFTTTYYTIEQDAVTEPIRIAQLSDLHNCEFGEDNVDLVTAVASENPDLIFITGDAVTMFEEQKDSMVRLVEKLVLIAPVYFSYGNHEIGYRVNYGVDAGELFANAGAVVLDYSYEDIDIKGQKLRIGGIYGYCTPAKYLKTNEAEPEECDFLTEFQNTDRTTLLLAHMPFAWIENDGISEWDIDIVFAGHSHGGQIRIPLIGGVYAPDQGWFPGQVSGEFKSGDGEKTLIVSRGLGDSVEIPRINNKPELVIVDITSK